MSTLGILAIVAGVLLAGVVVVGVVTAVRTRAMRDRDLALADVLVGEETQARSAYRPQRLSQVSRDADRRRRMLEQATFSWEQLGSGTQTSLVEHAAHRRGEDPGELSSLINDLIQTGRRTHAGVVLLSAAPMPPGVQPVSPLEVGTLEPLSFQPTPADTVMWYRDQLLSLHPAYLAIRATLLERVTELITLIIRAEQNGEIPPRRSYPPNLRAQG